MYKSEKISNSVIKRLPRYYRFLGELMNEGVEKISSKELSERMSLTASQIRQDFNCFGGFGQQGYGYNVAALRLGISGVLGLDKPVGAILIGAGNLGHAIAYNINFDKRGCRLIGIFDKDPDLKNNVIAGHSVMDISGLSEFCAEHNPKIAVLCIPKDSVKEVCDSLIGLGVSGFLNFSHYDINLHYKEVNVENVHLGDSLLKLVYNVNNS